MPTLEMLQHQYLPAIVTIVGLFLTAIIAYATYRTFRLQLQLVALSRPTMADLYLRRGEAADEPHEVRFEVADNHAAAWQINSVYAKPVWRANLSEVGNVEHDFYGSTARIYAKGWVRSVIYDPPIRKSSILLRPDSPNVIVLVFRLQMKASPSIQSTCAVRLRVHH